MRRSPELRQPKQQVKKQPLPTAFGDETFRKEVRDAIDEMLSEQGIEWRNKMQHQGGAAGK